MRCGRRPEKRFFKRRRLTIRQQEDLTRRGGLTGGFLPWGWGREGRHFPASPGGTAPGGAVRMQRRGGVRQGREGRFLPRAGKGGGVLGLLGCWMSKRRVWTPTSGLQLQVGFLVAGHSGAQICRGLSALRDLLDKSQPLSGLPLTLCKMRRWLDLEGFWWLTAHSSWRCGGGGRWHPGQKQAGRPLSSFVDQWAPQSGESGFVGKIMSLLLNMLSTLVITFLPRSKRLLISWLQSPSAMIFEPPQNKVSHSFHCLPT